MRADVAAGARDAALASGFLAVIGAYVAAYVLLFRWNSGIAMLALALHLVVLLLVLIRTRREPTSRSARRREARADGDDDGHGVIDLTTHEIAPFLRRARRRAPATRESPCSVTDISSRRRPLTRR